MSKIHDRASAITTFIKSARLISNMTRYRCGNCNYTFTPKAQVRAPSRCPYCSEEGSLAQERSIIDEVNQARSRQ